MNRIDKKFVELKEAGRKALISFITAGDPDIQTTCAFVKGLEKAGVDIIELGIPFSDPVAEGPVIQAASERALRAGTKTDQIFDAVKKLRTITEIPILFMMYVNCIYGYGKERFFENCKEAGVDGVIVPDLPFEEQGEILDMAKAHGVHSIFLVAPTSDQRIGRIVESAQGFIYCVSSRGVTGTRAAFDTNFGSFSCAVKKKTKTPACVGFGISGPEQAAHIAKYFDGVIMGSAFVKLIEQYGVDSLSHVARLAAETRKTLDDA